MQVKEIVKLLNAREIYVDDTSIYEKNYDKGEVT